MASSSTGWEVSPSDRVTRIGVFLGGGKIAAGKTGKAIEAGGDLPREEYPASRRVGRADSLLHGNRPALVLPLPEMETPRGKRVTGNRG